MSLQHNIEYLKKRSSNISFDHIMAAVDGGPICEVSRAAEGIPVFEAGNDAKVQIHSRRDPEGEAARQVASWIEKSSPSFDGFVLAAGFGGMYHLKELASKLRPGGMLLVVEKYPCMIRKALDFCDLGKLACVDGACVVFIASDSEEELKLEYRHYLSTRKDFNVSVFIHPGLSRAFPGVYEGLVSILKDETAIELMVQNTKANLGREWLEHAICNIPEIFDSYDLNVLRERHAGSAAIVVAAGPSLDESAAFIQRVRGKCIVIAVGRAFRPLLNKGIKPDYIIHMDTDPSLLQHFDDISPGDSVLLAELFVYPGLASLFKGRTFFFSVSAVPGFEDFLKLGGISPVHLSSGGTVALSAIDAAVYMGCKRIFFMGLDLAFEDGGPTHAGDSAYAKRHKKTSSPIVKVKGNYKEEVTTLKEFADYIKMIGSYLEGVSRKGGVEFFNVTGAGAALPHCNLIEPSGLEPMCAGLPEASSIRPDLPSFKTYTERLGKEKLVTHLQCCISELNDSASLAGDMLASGPDAATIRKIKSLRCAEMLLDDALRMLKYADTPESGRALWENHKAACEWLASLLASAETSYRDRNELIYG